MKSSTLPSKKQAEVLAYVDSFLRKNGYSPSLTEIAGNFNVSVPTIHQHVSALKKKNLISSQKSKRRSIESYYSDRPATSVTVPLMGLIAAGGPIEAIRDVRPVEVPKNMVPPGSKYFALKVAGDSMIEDGIPDGSIVIMREQNSADDGDRVVVYLPDKNEVTLKRLYKEKSKFKLVSANKKYKPFYENNVEVQGKVMGVISAEF